MSVGISLAGKADKYKVFARLADFISSYSAMVIHSAFVMNKEQQKGYSKTRLCLGKDKPPILMNKYIYPLSYEYIPSTLRKLIYS